MNNREYVYKYILESVKNSRIDKESALKILKELNLDKKNAGIKNSSYAIIGMEGYFPKANSKEEYWDNIMHKRNCVDNFPFSRRKDTDYFFENQVDDLEGFYGKGGFISEIDRFDAHFFKIPPKEAEYMDPIHRIFLEISYRTFEDAGYGGRIAGTNTGVFVGRDFTIESEYNRLYDHSDILATTGSWTSMLVSRVSYIFNLHGKCWVMDTACSSALVALHEACNSIANQECDMALVGGVNIFSVPRQEGRLNGIHSTDGIIRTFDNKATGTVWGEGCAAVLIKSLDEAIVDGDNIYSVIKGSAVNNDGASNGLTSPNPDAQKEVMIEAWRKAGISPESLGYIEAHGTGTVVGDPIEIKSITKAMRKFTSKRQFCAIGTTKTMVGHLVGASGMAALFKVVMALQKKCIPAGINFEEPNEFIDFCNSPIYVNIKKRAWESNRMPRRAGINAFGIGGSNCHMVLEEYVSDYVNEKRDDSALLLCISAKNRSTLRTMVKKHFLFLLKNPELNLGDYTYTANVGRGHYEYRLAVVFNGIGNLIYKLRTLLELNNLEDWNQSDTFYDEIHEISLTKNIVELEKDNQVSDVNYYQKLAKLYVTGEINDLSSCYKEQYSKMSIPQYEMDKKRYWRNIELNTFVYSNNEQVKPEANKIYQIVWKKYSDRKENEIKDTGKYIILVSQDNAIDKAVVSGIFKKYKNVILVEFDEKCSKRNENCYIVSTIEELFHVLDIFTFGDVSDIIWLAGYNQDKNLRVDNNSKSLNFMMFSSYLCKRVEENINLIVVAVDTVDIYGQTCDINIVDKSILGLCKVISQDNYLINVRYIDVSYDNLQVNELVDEIISRSPDQFVALRNQERFREELIEVELKKTNKNLWIHEGGVYIIAGGTGGIGLTVGSYLANINKVHLILLGNKKLSIEELKDDCQELISIEKSGTTVEYISVDLADEKAINSMSEIVRSRYKQVDGIVHCAGIAMVDNIADLNMLDYEKCVNIKVVGALMLGKMFNKASFYILFSSLTAIIGGQNFGAYAAANACLTNVSAFLRKKNNMNASVITIPAVSDVGMLENIEINDDNQLFLSIERSKISIYLDTLFGILPNTDFVMGDINYNSSVCDCLDLLPVIFSDNIHNRIVQKKKEKVEKKVNVILTGKPYGEYTEYERKIGNIYSSVLGYNEIDIYSKLFDLGADSIHAMKIVNSINSKLSVRISIAEAMHHASIFELSKYLDESGDLRKNMTESNILLQVIPKSDYYPISAAQKRMYILSEINKIETGYNITQAMRVKGNLNKDKVCNTFRKIIQRHESLRTSFCLHNGIPVQIVHDSFDIDFTYLEIDEEQVETVMKEFIRPFDLSIYSLIRILLIHIGENDDILAFDIHHIIADRISINIIMKEFIELYKGTDLPDLVFQYKDYAAWHNQLLKTDMMKEQKEYWLKRFKTINQNTLVSGENAINTYAGNVINFEIEEVKARALKKLASEHRGTLFMILLAVFQVELFLLSDNEDIVVGCPVAGRNIQEVNNMVGVFTNTLPIRSYVDCEQTFIEFLNQVIKNTMDGFNHQDYPFDELVHQLGIKRELEKNPIFNELFLFHNVDFGNMDSGDLEFTKYNHKEEVARFDITMEVIEKNGVIYVGLDYLTCKFSQKYMHEMEKDLKNLIDSIIATPDIRICDLEVYKMKRQLIRKQIKNGVVNLDADFNL